MVLSVVQPALLITVPLALLLLGTSWRRPLVVIAGAVLLVVSLARVGSDPLANLERGWALLLGAWFLVAVVALPARRFMERALVSIFAAGVVVGALTASYGGGSNTPSQTTPSVAPEPAAVRPGASGLEDRGADRVGGGLENRGGLEDRGAEPAGSARAVGTALVAPPQANVSRPSGHRGTLIVTSQPVGASVSHCARLQLTDAKHGHTRIQSRLQTACRPAGKNPARG